MRALWPRPHMSIEECAVEPQVINYMSQFVPLVTFLFFFQLLVLSSRQMTVVAQNLRNFMGKKL